MELKIIMVTIFHSEYGRMCFPFFGVRNFAFCVGPIFGDYVINAYVYNICTYNKIVSRSEDRNWVRRSTRTKT